MQGNHKASILLIFNVHFKFVELLGCLGSAKNILPFHLTEQRIECEGGGWFCTYPFPLFFPFLICHWRLVQMHKCFQNHLHNPRARSHTTHTRVERIAHHFYLRQFVVEMCGLLHQLVWCWFCGRWLFWWLHKYTEHRRLAKLVRHCVHLNGYLLASSTTMQHAMHAKPPENRIR